MSTMKICAGTCLLLATLAAAADMPDPALRAACIAQSHQTVRVAAADTSVEARAIWIDHTRLRWPGIGDGQVRLHHSSTGQLSRGDDGSIHGADGVFELEDDATPLSPELEARFRWVGPGRALRVREQDREALRAVIAAQWWVTVDDKVGHVFRATNTQRAGLLDAVYAERDAKARLGASIDGDTATFRLWAPTAQRVTVCLYPDDATAASETWPLAREPDSGVWLARSRSESRYYAYLVDVVVPGVGLVRNRVGDPYAVSLGVDSHRSYLADLDDPALKPAGWDKATRPQAAMHAVDQIIYELHVRDFSVGDASVPAAHRGKYLGFTARDSAGMRHLRALADAGMTDAHLLPVFDFATVPELGCVTPAIDARGDSESAADAIARNKASDCFNWGYDPMYFGAPEGSYASDAADGGTRVREFRAMVMALHAAGLRVGMDVVYNHTSAAGQDARSVLDRIVPGYYQRLDATGAVTTSTCCTNTATEHAMMAKLMIDTALRWVRDYRIDSFRFDLMGHQPRAAMEQLQRALDTAAERRIPLLGEGWNFGEVADGARFVQAAQLSLGGSGIATFSDRARDAVRGGGPADGDARLVSAQGFVNGLHYAPNALAAPTSSLDLMRSADMVRLGLAASLREYAMQDHRGQVQRLAVIPYGGRRPGGYAMAPGEVVNYVENHDNQTLFDINAFKLPTDTSPEDRARVQILAAAINLFSQGVAYFHAGIDMLRSKSLDRNSYDSGDWFNRIDWTATTNHFGSGLPPRQDNEATWPLMRPLLANAAIAPPPAQIAWARDAFRDLLRIRASSTLLRLRTTKDVQTRLWFPNTGPQQVPTVVAGVVEGRDYEGADFRALAYFVNVDVDAHDIELPDQAGRGFVLHPVHRANGAADRRAAEQARFDDASGRFTIPARTAVVFVVE